MSSYDRTDEGFRRAEGSIRFMIDMYPKNTYYLYVPSNRADMYEVSVFEPRADEVAANTAVAKYTKETFDA